MAKKKMMKMMMESDGEEANPSIHQSINQSI